MTDDTPTSTTPALEAMRLAMKQAEEAAAARLAAKQASRDAAASEQVDMLAELALLAEPVVPAHLGHHAFALDEVGNLDALIADAAAVVPELPGEERDGDLVVVRHDAPASPWYQEAAEAALPAALRGIVGPIDVKTLLQALLVEIGDVKRTNAMLMEGMTRMEEKVDRVSRQLKERRP